MNSDALYTNEVYSFVHLYVEFPVI